MAKYLLQRLSPYISSLSLPLHVSVHPLPLAQLASMHRRGTHGEGMALSHFTSGTPLMGNMMEDEGVLGHSAV